jgi:hypothetical protein
MERRPELGFKSYDPLFPSQDTVPKGGFGNLIALPLQRRARDYGNSVFVDLTCTYRDQWAFLANLHRLTPEDAYSIVGAAAASDRVLAVRMPIADENGDEPWNQSALRRQSQPPITEPLPDRVKITLADDIYVDRTALPSTMVARLIRLAAFQNPEFYKPRRCVGPLTISQGSSPVRCYTKSTSRCHEDAWKICSSSFAVIV